MLVNDRKSRESTLIWQIEQILDLVNLIIDTTEFALSGEIIRIPETFQVFVFMNESLWMKVYLRVSFHGLLAV